MPNMRVSFLFILTFLCLQLFSQHIRFEGVVVDAQTKETIPFTNIFVESQGIGTLSNLEGVFYLPFRKP